MIVSRAPLRISFAGGITDIPQYYETLTIKLDNEYDNQKQLITEKGNKLMETFESTSKVETEKQRDRKTE